MLRIKLGLGVLNLEVDSRWQQRYHDARPGRAIGAQTRARRLAHLDENRSWAGRERFRPVDSGEQTSGASAIQLRSETEGRPVPRPLAAASTGAETAGSGASQRIAATTTSIGTVRALAEDRATRTYLLRLHRAYQSASSVPAGGFWNAPGARQSQIDKLGQHGGDPFPDDA